MRKIAEDYAANLRHSDSMGVSRADDVCLAKIGDALRHCYGDMTGAEQPQALVDLARTIDARRDQSTDEAA